MPNNGGNLRKRYEFRWDVLDIIIGGKSSIDSAQGFQVGNLGDREDDPTRVDLVLFDTKPKKSRNSTLLKLLHKPENVAEDIFDRVGIRFIVQTPLSALQVVKYLKDK